MKYISIKIEPKGKIPVTGMMKEGSAYQGARGIGLKLSSKYDVQIKTNYDDSIFVIYLGILLTLHGGSYLPIQCLPTTVPTMERGRDTNSQIAIILIITDKGIALNVS